MAGGRKPSKTAKKEDPGAISTPAKPAKKDKKGKSADGSSKWPSLAMIRPAPRPVFLILFFAYCFAIALLHDRCNLQGKKKDCGHPGISTQDCLSYACLIKGATGSLKKNVVLNVAESEEVGLVLGEGSGGMLWVNGVTAGAVKKHNDKQPQESQERVLVGDAIVKVSGSSKDMVKTLTTTTKKVRTFKLEVRRPTLPRYLSWVHTMTDDLSRLETVLTAPGTQYLATLMGFNLKIGLACWYISGYGFASIPAYVFASGIAGFQLSRCCHDTKVPEGVPHCYLGSRVEPAKVVEKVGQKILDMGRKFINNPSAHLQWLTGGGLKR